ncbi:hypothetical protein FNA31_06160 [Escherichia coli]|nr:hypothetical protein [Escherichia coli]EFE6998901.1 hypothetical protein [Escherichia coli]EFE8622310.1 hypothetical protein [Escherichia coli O103]EFN9584215.1 hypothetical protein [Escherichia coli]
MEKQSGQERLTAIFNSDILFISLFQVIAGPQFLKGEIDHAGKKSKAPPLINKSVVCFLQMQ